MPLDYTLLQTVRMAIAGAVAGNMYAWACWGSLGKPSDSLEDATRKRHHTLYQLSKSTPNA